MRRVLVLSAVLASLLSASAAQAGLIGLKVEGNITDGQQSDEDLSWNWSTKTIKHGVEFRSLEDGNRASANFKDTRLVIRDMERPRQTSSGWEMTFKLISPAEFKDITLIRSNFGENLTYALVGDVLTITFAGDKAYADMTRKERRELGGEKFHAIFSISGQAVVVPEPPAMALMLAGLIAAGAFAARRRKSTSA